MLLAKRTLAIVALTTTIASCSGEVIPATTPTSPAETLRVYSTTATYPLTLDLTTSYGDHEPHIAFETQSANFQVMMNKLNREEMPYFLSNYLPSDSPLWAAPIAEDGLAVITHPDVAVGALTTAQLRAIYQGQLTNWRQLGGPSQEIVVFSRETGSGTRAAFERLVMGARPTFANARLATSNTQMVEQVAQVEGSIGYASMGYINGAVQTLAIDGVALSVENVAAKQYPLRSLIFVIGLSAPQDAYLDWIAWVQSNVGQAIVRRRYAPIEPLKAAS